MTRFAVTDVVTDTKMEMCVRNVVLKIIKSILKIKYKYNNKKSCHKWQLF